jgi:hypothetical protein
MYVLQDAGAMKVHLSYYSCAYGIVLLTSVRLHVTVKLVLVDYGALRRLSEGFFYWSRLRRRHLSV